MYFVLSQLLSQNQEIFKKFSLCFQIIFSQKLLRMELLLLNDDDIDVTDLDDVHLHTHDHLMIIAKGDQNTANDAVLTENFSYSSTLQLN